MPCRVGITTDPDTRKKYWENQVVGFSRWRILKSFSTKDAAQKFENEYSKKHGCKAHAGGPDTKGTWYAYRFDFSRSK